LTTVAGGWPVGDRSNWQLFDVDMDQSGALHWSNEQDFGVKVLQSSDPPFMKPTNRWRRGAQRALRCAERAALVPQVYTCWSCCGSERRAGGAANTPSIAVLRQPASKTWR